MSHSSIHLTGRLLDSSLRSFLHHPLAGDGDDGTTTTTRERDAQHGDGHGGDARGKEKSILIVLTFSEINGILDIAYIEKKCTRHHKGGPGRVFPPRLPLTSQCRQHAAPPPSLPLSLSVCLPCSIPPKALLPHLPPPHQTNQPTNQPTIQHTITPPPPPPSTRRLGRW